MNPLKKITPAAAFMLFACFSYGQGLQKIIVEQYYKTNAADAAQNDADIKDYNISNGTDFPTGTLPAGSVTYRFFADMDPGYKLLSVYADVTRSQSLVFTTTTGFYNNPGAQGLVSPVPGTSLSDIENNLRILDSYLTLGAVAANTYAVLKSDDPGGDGINSNRVSSPNKRNVLLNNEDADMCIPLTTRDGLHSSSASGPVHPVYFGFKDSHNRIFADASATGSSFILKDGSYFNTSGAVGNPDLNSNRVLIAQLTTNGTLHYELNVLIQKVGGGPGLFYTANPVDADLTHPSLKGDITGLTKASSH